MSADARVPRPIRSTRALASIDTTLSVLEAFGLFLSRLDALRKSHDSGTWHCDTTFCDYVSRPMMRLAAVPAFLHLTRSFYLTLLACAPAGIISPSIGYLFVFYVFSYYILMPDN